ncbi:MAG: hypothetical protein AAFN13_12030, partial [Bacteroidota bacterium]
MSRSRLFLLSLPLLLAALAACERPFVEETPPRITILSPDLSAVLADPTVTVEIAVSSELRAVDTVRVNGQGTTFDASTQTYRAEVTLAPGVNALRIEAVDSAGNLSRATRFGVFLPAVFALQPLTTSFLQMPTPLGGHAATRLADGRVLITGGTQQAEGVVRDRAYVFDPATNAFETLANRMVEARTGHTASLLPDGRVLIVGGTRLVPATDFSDFVVDAELFDPETGTFSRVTLTERSPTIIRAEHAAHVVEVDGGTFVYLIGGRGRITLTGTAVGTRSDFRILALQTTEDGTEPVLDSGLSVGPELARTPTAVSAFTFNPLGPQNAEGFGDFLLAGTYVPPSGSLPDSVALAVTLDLDPSYDDVPVSPMTTARIAHAGAAIEDGLVLLAGGQVLGIGAPVPEAEVYVAEAARFFPFPLESGAPRLNVARYGHTATKLDDDRIL